MTKVFITMFDRVRRSQVYCVMQLDESVNSGGETLSGLAGIVLSWWTKFGTNDIRWQLCQMLYT